MRENDDHIYMYMGRGMEHLISIHSTGFPLTASNLLTEQTIKLLRVRVRVAVTTCIIRNGYQLQRRSYNRDFLNASKGLFLPYEQKDQHLIPPIPAIVYV